MEVATSLASLPGRRSHGDRIPSPGIRRASGSLPPRGHGRPGRVDSSDSHIEAHMSTRLRRSFRPYLDGSRLEDRVALATMAAAQVGSLAVSEDPLIQPNKAV